MDVSTTTRYILNLIGLRPDHKKRFRTILILIVAAILFVSLILQIVYRWDHFDIRVLALKDLNAMISSTSFPLEQIFSKFNMYDTLKLIESPTFEYGRRTKEKEELYEDYKNKLSTTCGKTFKMLVSIISTLVVTPFLVTLFLLFTQRGKIHVENLPLPMSCYIPPGLATLKVYFLVYAIDIVLYGYVFSYTACTFIMIYSALQNIVFDFRLLTLSVIEIDKIEQNFSDQELEHRIRRIVQHHQFICRKVKLVNKLVQTALFNLNNALCFQLCTCLYCAIEMDELILKLEYLFLTFPVVYVTLNFCSNGQNILDANEDLRIALFRFDWVNKPIWFRKYIVIMLINMQQDKEIKPFGLYVLNLRNFTHIMKGAYSYFHMIRNFRRGFK